MADWLLEPLSHGFMQRAWLGTACCAAACACIGVHLVARRMTFVGSALTHTLLPGVVGAWLLGLSPHLGAMASALAPKRQTPLVPTSSRCTGAAREKPGMRWTRSSRHTACSGCGVVGSCAALSTATQRAPPASSPCARMRAGIGAAGARSTSVSTSCVCGIMSKASTLWAA